MKYLNEIKKYKIYIIFIVIGLFIVSGYIWASKVTATYKEPVKPVLTEEKIEEDKTIIVDIKGEVEKPGVYEMDSNERVNDLIKKAGGLKEEANTDIINLSQKLKDEDVIIIYSNNEIESFKKEEKSKYNIKTSVMSCPDINNACINKTKEVKKEESKKEVKEQEIKSQDIKVNINDASIEEFTSLPNIGESKALKIIKYREENGNFESIEDLKKVSGIGDKLYEAIKDYITV